MKISASRRHILAGIGAVVGASFASVRAAAAAPRRIVALEWRYADHAMSLGLMPVGIADLKEYARLRSTDVDALRAAGTVDLGRRQEPSLEAIMEVRPDLIAGVGFRHERILPYLSSIAPTVLYDYTASDGEEGGQLPLMLNELADLGVRLGRESNSRAAVEGFDAIMDERRRALADAGLGQAAVVFAQFPSGVSAVRLFTSDSLPVMLLRKLGLRNAWNGPSEGFGFTTVSPEQLLSLGEVYFLALGIGRDNGYTRLSRTPVWQALPFVRTNRFHWMSDADWPFGGLQSAEAFGATIVRLLDK